MVNLNFNFNSKSVKNLSLTFKLLGLILNFIAKSKNNGAGQMGQSFKLKASTVTFKRTLSCFIILKYY